MYRNITGNEALALGLVAGCTARRQDAVLRRLSDHARVATSCTRSRSTRTSACVTFQAEDEIAAIGAAIGAAYGGAIAVTAIGGPGIALKGEAIGLAVMAELPLVILERPARRPVDGLPTKTEQADLCRRCTAATASRRCRCSPRPTPGDCFYCADRGRADRVEVHGAR